jgi:predicted RNA binding protein YcfA (HicA-like mRNA interferase family)
MPLSGKQTLAILVKFGFRQVRQRGSHAVLVKQTSAGKRVAVVPMHQELQKGTLRSIAAQADIDRKVLGV